MTNEQKRALALAAARKRKAEATQAPQETTQAPTPAPTTRTSNLPPMEDPQMSMDALTVSDVGIESSPQNITATVRNVLQGLSFGTADEAEAALRSAFGDQTYSENLEQIRAETKAYAEENPGSALAQELVGAVMSPASLLKAPKYIERAAPLVRGGVKGGTGGFVYGVGSAEGGVGERVEEGFVGAGAGMLIGAPLEKAVSLLGNAPLNRTIKRQNRAPSVDNLKGIKDAAYEAVDQTNFALGPGEAQQIFQRASGVADANFYKPMPGVTTSVDKARRLLEDLTTKGMTLGQSEKVRRRLFELAKDPKEGYIVRQMISEFDEVIEDSLAAGQIPQLKIAREANRRYKNSELLQEAFDAVEEGSTSKMQAYQKAARRILGSDKQLKYFNPREVQLLEELSSGSASQAVLNAIGKFDFSGRGLASAINFYTISQAPIMALLYLGTKGSKYLADNKTRKIAQRLIQEAGGVEVVRKATENANLATAGVGGLTADEIRQALSLDQAQEETQE